MNYSNRTLTENDIYDIIYFTLGKSLRKVGREKLKDYFPEVFQSSNDVSVDYITMLFNIYEPDAKDRLKHLNDCLMLSIFTETLQIPSLNSMPIKTNRKKDLKITLNEGFQSSISQLDSSNLEEFYDVMHDTKIKLFEADMQHLRNSNRIVIETTNVLKRNSMVFNPAILKDFSLALELKMISMTEEYHQVYLRESTLRLNIMNKEYHLSVDTFNNSLPGNVKLFSSFESLNWSSHSLDEWENHIRIKSLKEKSDHLISQPNEENNNPATLFNQSLESFLVPTNTTALSYNDENLLGPLTHVIHNNYQIESSTDCYPEYNRDTSNDTYSSSMTVNTFDYENNASDEEESSESEDDYVFNHLSKSVRCQSMENLVNSGYRLTILRRTLSQSNMDEFILNF